MRLLVVTFTFIAFATFVTAANADDTLQRSTEVQVLDRFVGEWSSVVTNEADGSTSRAHLSRSTAIVS